MKKTNIQIGIFCVVVFLLVTAGTAKANIWCQWFRYCYYESPGFKIRVVDKESGKPLADVHGLAVWIQYGMWGQKPGLMAQDVVSDKDGWLVFPPWGPISGSMDGLETGRAPEVTLYKIGYEVVTLDNRVWPPREHDRVRRFAQDGETFTLAPFRGSVEERLKQLFIARGHGAPVHKEPIKLFGTPYLNRWRRLIVEKDNLPQRYQNAGQFFWHVEKEILEYEGINR